MFRVGSGPPATPSAQNETAPFSLLRFLTLSSVKRKGWNTLRHLTTAGVYNAGAQSLDLPKPRARFLLAGAAMRRHVCPRVWQLREFRIRRLPLAQKPHIRRLGLPDVTSLLVGQRNAI